MKEIFHLYLLLSFPEEPEVDLNEDFGDLSKSLADLDITADIPEPESESEPMLEGKNPIVNNFGQEPKGPALPPFPELRFLNLSSNMVRFKLLFSEEQLDLHTSLKQRMEV